MSINLIYLISTNDAKNVSGQFIFKHSVFYIHKDSSFLHS